MMMAGVDVTGAESERILILAPLGRDAAVACEALGGAGLACTVCRDLNDLRDKLIEGAGAVLLTQEVLTPRGVKELEEVLAAQPAWSDLPLVLFVGSSRAGAGRLLEPVSAFGQDVTVLERPVRTLALITVMRSALHSRRRQYEIRDLLAQLSEANELLERRVEARVAEVRSLVSELTLAEARERHRIAQLLHDELQQELFAVQYALHDALAQAERLDDKPRARLQEAYTLLRDAIRNSRGLTRDLSPPLQGEGLVEALHWLTARVHELYKLRITLRAPAALSVLNEGLETLLFAVVRELLFNIVKHAGVDTATVTLTETMDCLVVEVVDRGRGFDPEQVQSGVAKETGLGLESVRKRLQLFGGGLELVSRPGEGTTATLKVPIASFKPTGKV